MTVPQMGILVGATLALSWMALGFWACVLVAAAMAGGFVAARAIEGSVDWRQLAGALRGKRSSS